VGREKEEQKRAGKKNAASLNHQDKIIVLKKTERRRFTDGCPIVRRRYRQMDQDAIQSRRESGTGSAEGKTRDFWVFTSEGVDRGWKEETMSTRTEGKQTVDGRHPKGNSPSIRAKKREGTKLQASNFTDARKDQDSQAEERKISGCRPVSDHTGGDRGKGAGRV